MALLATVVTTDGFVCCLLVKVRVASAGQAAVRGLPGEVRRTGCGCRCLLLTGLLLYSS
jgi:hypothetical protein